MNRRVVVSASLILLLAGVALSPACSTADGKSVDRSTPESAPIVATPVAATEQPIARFIRATGSLMAEDQADVAAEVAGRVIATPVEREAEANAAQIEARLGLKSGTFDVNAVPEVQNAKASFELAQNEFNRIRALLDDRVVSQSEFDQRRTQMEAARQQYEAAKNGAAQQYQALQGAKARVAIARKAVADTVVRAPFTGLVAERLVSVGDYVTKGLKIAVVVRMNPLRVQLTVPEQFVSAVAAGAPVVFEVDAYPGRQFAGKVRFVSPALEAAQRALTVEAVVPNPGLELKPGLFATARIEQPVRTPAVLVPAAAVHTIGGTSRVFVVLGDRAEERLVTVGQTVETQVEISNGLKVGERVATTNVAELSDGAKVS
jgi:membrane fusion protein (multidrug efflux system)